MSLWEAVIAGILQGVTEFLPVSSSGHLVLLHRYFGHKTPQLLFDIFLHVGTLFAIFVYFRKDIIGLFTKEKKSLLLIFISCIPTSIIGIFIESFFKNAFSNIKLVGLMLIITAAFLFLADFTIRLKKESGPGGVNIVRALIIGAMQGIAALPGLSRSGVTISTALVCGVKKQDAIRYSFLLAIPAIIGAFIFELKDLGSIYSASIPQIFIGTFTAFLVGLAAIYILVKTIMKNKLFLFAGYCLFLGTAALIKSYMP
jgi:undecaprenyl-diphosphatase